MQDVFVDRMGPIHISQGVVRVDPEHKQVGYSPALRVVMPLNGFIQAVQQLN